MYTTTVLWCIFPSAIWVDGYHIICIWPLYCGAFAEILNKTYWHPYCHLQFCEDQMRHDCAALFMSYWPIYCIIETEIWDTLHCILLTNVDRHHYTVVSATWDTTVLWCIDDAVLTQWQITVLWWIDCAVLTQWHILLYWSIQWLQPIGLRDTTHHYIVMCYFTHYQQGGHDVLITVIDLATWHYYLNVECWQKDSATQDSLSLYCDATWENDYE